MRTRTKIWLIIAASLVLIGCILFAGTMQTLKWDFMELATVKYETNIYEISETFDDISVNTDTADIAFVLSDDGNCRVECYEEANAKHSVTVEDGALTIELMDEKTVYDFIGTIGLNFGSSKITVYLPQKEYASLDLTVSTGKVTVSDVTCEGDITVSVSTGKTQLDNVRCKNVISNGSTGDISIDNVIAEEKFSIRRNTGKVKFIGSDATEIFVKTSTGDVEGSLLTDKVFFVKTSTGDVDVPKTMNGDRCEIITDTGDIKMDIKE